MKKLHFIFLFGAIVCGCKTDFDVIAPYKETIVIDGLLDPLLPVQHIKVSKVFLGEGNALVMAQQKDSVNYGDILDVKLEGINNNQVIQTFNLQRTEYSDKEPGTFTNFYVVYATSPGDSIYQDGRKYKVTVTNRETGVTATSTTLIVKDLTVNTPYSLFHQDSLTVNFSGLSPYKPGFSPASNSNASIFDFILRVHYRELDPSGTSREDSLDWNFPEQFEADNGEVSFLFYKDNFFNFIGNSIHAQTGYSHRMDSLANGRPAFEFIFIEGSEDLKTYIQLNEPSSGIVQEKPLFTTVVNGLGLFSSRVIHRTYAYPSPETEVAFDTSRFTSNLHFNF